jgi:hypothetical protein
MLNILGVVMEEIVGWLPRANLFAIESHRMIKCGCSTHAIMTFSFQRHSVYALAALAVVIVFLVPACAVNSISHTTTAQSTRYDTYINARFGYSICYPPENLLPQGESDNGDGQRFLSKDGRTTMLVYGSLNVLNQTLSNIRQSEIERFTQQDSSFKTIQTQITGDITIISGTSDTLNYYEKVMLSGDTVFTFIAQYPKREATIFGPVVSRMTDGFMILRHSTQ